MASDITISTLEIAKLANTTFGTKETVLYYARIAKDAGARAKNAATIPNAVMMAQEMQTMTDAVANIVSILSSEKSALPQEK